MSLKIFGKNAFHKVVETVTSVSEKHGTTIALVVGVTGVVVTTALAFRAGKKVADEMEIMKGEEDISKTEIKPIEKVKRIVPIVAPTILSAGTTIFCIVYLKTKSDEKIAALTAAYSMAEAGYQELQKAVDESMEPEKAKEVKDRAAEKAVQVVSENDILPGVIYTGDGNDLFYDPFTGRYFMCRAERIRTEENTFNKVLRENPFGTRNLQQFWDNFNNIGQSAACEDAVFDYSNMETLNISFYPTFDKTYQKPCIELQYHVPHANSY